MRCINSQPVASIPAIVLKAATDNPRLRRQWLIGLLVVAAAVRVGAAVQLPCIAPDGVFFITFAKQLAEKPRYYLREQKKQPGYSAVLLAAHGALEGWKTTSPALVWQGHGQGIAVASGLFAVWLVYLLTRRCFDGTVALVAMALAALWPQGVELSADVLSDMPHLAIYLGGMLLGIRAVRNGSLTAALGCGLVGGVAYLFRQEGLGLPIALSAALAWTWWTARASQTAETRGRRMLAQGVLAGIGFVIAVAPYALAVGRWMSNKTLGDLLFGPEEIGMIGGSAPERLAAVVRGWEIPLKMAEGWARSGRYVFSTWAIVGLAWAAVPRCEVNARRMITAAVALQVVATALRGLQFGEVSGRYMVLPTVLCLPWAAAALVTVWRRLVSSPTNEGQRGGAGLRLLTGFALIAVVFVPLGYFVVRPADPAAGAPRQAGEWLKTLVPPFDTILIEPKLGRLAFYADRQAVWPPENQRLADFVTSPPYRTAAWFVDQPNPAVRASPRRHPESDALLETLRARAKSPIEVSRWTAFGLHLRAYRLAPPSDVSEAPVDRRPK